MVELKVKGKIQNLQKKEKNKVLRSNFLLTINTNQQYKDDDKHLESDTKIFDEVINDILNHIQEYINIKEGDDFERDVHDADIDYVIERGTKKGQIHTHIMFKFKHNTRIQLNYDKIKERIKQRLGLNNVYMYNKLVRNSGSDNILDYISKYQ
jgi:hypothetical protein